MAKSKEYEMGFKAACAMVDEMYAKVCRHPYLLGECVMAKTNLLKGKPKKNPFYKPRTGHMSAKQLQTAINTVWAADPLEADVVIKSIMKMVKKLVNHIKTLQSYE